MTLICDFCKKPLKALDNKPITLGETTLDFHPECNPKWIDRIVNGAQTPLPSPTPVPTPTMVVPVAPLPKPLAQLPTIQRPPQKRSFWGFGKPKHSKAQKAEGMSEEELAGAFG
jgi:hypothetical protein